MSTITSEEIVVQAQYVESPQPSKMKLLTNSNDYIVDENYKSPEFN